MFYDQHCRLAEIEACFGNHRINKRGLDFYHWKGLYELAVKPGGGNIDFAKFHSTDWLVGRIAFVKFM